VEDLVRQAVGFDAGRGDMVSVVNAPFVREQQELPAPPWWENPQLRDILRVAVGALVVLLLAFGVLRPAIRQIVSPEKPKKEEPEALEQQTAEVSLVEDEVPELAEDTAQLTQEPPPALTSDSYEDRLRAAREAVRADSKRVAQVVREWLGNETA
nr:flagellar M-ring protein FliF [Gammaproteobacteria bacterium]